MYEIFGISFNEIKSVNEKFAEIFNDEDNLFYESKETFKHEEEGFNFDYKFCIEGIKCEGKMFYCLCLVPLTLCEKAKEDVISCCGLEDESEITPYDICSYGHYVQLGVEAVEGEDDFSDLILDKIASVFETINSLRGFYLDRQVNRIGTTGWDLLDSAVNGTDWIEASLGRF